MVYTISGIRFPAIHSAYSLSWRSSFVNGDRRSTSLSLLLKKNSVSRKTFASKSSYESDSLSLTVASSDKVLVPGSKSDASASSTDQLEAPGKVSEDHQVAELDDKALVEETSDPLEVVASTKTVETTENKRTILPPGIGQRIYEIDPALNGHRQHLEYRYGQYKRLREEIDKYEGGLEAFSCGYEKFGFTYSETGIIYREWAPGAKSASLIGDFNNWNPNADIMTRNEFGVWEIFLPNNADGSPAIPHGSRVKSNLLSMEKSLSIRCHSFWH